MRSKGEVKVELKKQSMTNRANVITKCYATDDINFSSKRGKNVSHAIRLWLTLVAYFLNLFLPRFDVTRALPEQARTAKWNLMLVVNGDVHFLSERSHEDRFEGINPSIGTNRPISDLPYNQFLRSDQC